MEVLEFYKDQKQTHEEELSKYSRKLLFSSVLRLVVFLAICFGIYYFFGNANVIVSLVIAGIALFLFLGRGIAISRIKAISRRS